MKKMVAILTLVVAFAAMPSSAKAFSKGDLIAFAGLEIELYLIDSADSTTNVPLLSGRDANTMRIIALDILFAYFEYASGSPSLANTFIGQALNQYSNLASVVQNNENVKFSKLLLQFALSAP